MRRVFVASFLLTGVSFLLLVSKHVYYVAKTASNCEWVTGRCRYMPSSMCDGMKFDEAAVKVAVPNFRGLCCRLQEALLVLQARIPDAFSSTWRPLTNDLSSEQFDNSLITLGNICVVPGVPGCELSSYLYDSIVNQLEKCRMKG